MPEGSDGDWRSAYNQFMTTKTAEVVAPAKNTPRVINESLGYTGVTDGKVAAGANQLVVRVENNKASLQSFTGLTSYITLPEGVTYTGNDAQVDAKVVGGQTLLTINWDRTELGPNEANNITLDINVNDALDLPTVAVGLYSVVDQSDTVVPKSIDPTLDSDVRVLLGVDLPGLSMMRSVYALETVAGVYQPAGHQVLALAAAANNSGDKGDLVTVRANEDGQYILSLANTTDNALQNFRLTATLPQLNDRAVLGNALRGTTTSGVHMTGPIELPASWTDKANIDVRYTTAADQFGVPADKITDFKEVTGFVVTFVDPDAYLDGGLQSIVVPVHVDGDATAGDKAFISYSLMANDLAMTEGLKAGIEVGARQEANATVTYHDDTTDTDLLTVDAGTDPSLTGFVGGTSTYDSAAQIAEFTDKGYALVQDGTKKADGTTAIAFTTDGATTNYVVNLKHSYTVSAPHTMTRTIHYVTDTNQKLAPDHEDAVSFATVTDNVTDTSTTYVANGQVTAAKLTDGVPDAAWRRGDSATLPDVVNPKIANYVVKQTTDPSGDLEKTPSMTATAKSPDAAVTVTYIRAVSHLDKTQDAKLIVRYVDKNGKELKPSITKAGFVGNSYTVTAPDIARYTLISDQTASGTFTAADQTVTFVYDYKEGQVGTNQPATLTVRYVNKYGKELKPTITKDGVVGNGYTVTAPDIAGYTLTSDPMATGQFTPGNQTVTFVYDYTKGQVGTNQTATLTVRYVNKYGKELKPTVTKDGVVGTGYMVTAPEIAGYTLTSDPTATGKFTPGNHVVTFVYDYMKGQVGTNQTATLTVRYVNKYGKELKPNLTKEGVIGTGYTVTAPDIAGYTLTSNPTATGQFTPGNQTVTFVYDYTKGQVGTNQTATLTVRYVNKYGKELKPSITKEGVVGTGYGVTAPDIAGYTLTSDPTATGQFTPGNQTVTFIYDYTKGQVGTNQTAKLTVRYVNKYGKELMTSKIKTGVVGNNYMVTAPKITGYTLTSAPTARGTFTPADQTVTFVYDYTKGLVPSTQPAQLTVRYVGTDGTTLQPESIKAGVVGNSYGITPPTIDGYTYVGLGTASAQLTGKLMTGVTTVVLVYRLNALPDTGSVPPQKDLPNTGTDTPNTPELPVATPKQTGLPVTGGAVTPAATTQPGLPATGDQHTGVLAAFGMGLLALVSGAWFQRRKD